jgi:hypothetical protein
MHCLLGCLASARRFGDAKVLLTAWPALPVAGSFAAGGRGASFVRRSEIFLGLI